MSSDERWLDQDAGPVARPYTLTGGRTRPRGQARFDLIDIVIATGQQATDVLAVGPEHRRILHLCRGPMVVADLASDIGLSLGVIRVLLGDLAYQGLITVLRPDQEPATSEQLLREVLAGLRAL
jgi:hypothetical protein